MAAWRCCVLALALALSCAGPSAQAAATAPAPSAGPRRRQTSRPCKRTRDQLAYIAFVNDVHNRLEEEDPTTSTPCSPAARTRGTCVGGWPRISTAVAALRRQAAAEGAAFFFLHAGDEFTGSMWDAVYRGQTVAPLLMNAVGPDAMTCGNHELDNGPAALASFIGNLTFPFLGGCNVDASADPFLRGKLRSHVVLRAGDYKIGVVGWLTPTTAETARDAGGLKFRPIVPSVTACLAQLQAEQPDLDYVIGLSHSGYESDLDTARQVPGLDIIIGGHSHTFLYMPTSAGPVVARGAGVNASNCVAKGACDKPAGPYPTWAAGPSAAAGGNRSSGSSGASSNYGVPVVQAYYSSKYLGLIKVNLATRRLLPGVVPLLLGGANSSSNVGQDPALLAILDKYRGPVDRLQTQVAGRTLVPLEGDPAVSRTNETNLGDYVCEALLRAVPPAVTRAAGNVTICLLNAGAIRTGYKSTGDLTVGQVLTMLPYANALAIFSAKGSALLAALRNGLSAYPSGGRFLQVAGLRYFHDAGRFLSAVLLGPDGAPRGPIDPSATYTLVSLDYVLAGGDGFDFRGADVLLPAGAPYAQAVIDDLGAFPQGIAPTTHDRIIDCARWPTFPGCPAARVTKEAKRVRL